MDNKAAENADDMIDINEENKTTAMNHKSLTDIPEARHYSWHPVRQRLHRDRKGSRRP